MNHGGVQVIQSKVGSALTEQVLIEIKLTKNKDVKDKTYHKKLLRYIDGTKSDFGIYLIFQIADKEPWALLEPEVKGQFDHLSDKIKVIGLDCSKTI